MLGIPGATWGAILLGLVGILGFVIRTRVQSKANRELVEANAQKDRENAELRRQAEERAARHAKDAAEREAAAKERENDRAQIEKLIAQQQAQTEKVLSIMERELKVTQDMNARNFELLDRNTRAVERLAETAATMASEIRSVDGKVQALQTGAGCRAGSNGRST